MSLILESSDISPYVNEDNYPYTLITRGANGYMTGCRSNSTYFINLRTLLGDENYKKYDMFQLELLQFAYGTKSSWNISTFGGYAGASTTNLITRVSGLRFVTGPSVFMGGFHYNRSNSSALYNFNNGSETAVFYKPSDPRVELNLRLYTQAEVQDVPASWFTSSSHVSPPNFYNFRIIPYTEEYTEIFKQPLY